MPIRVCIDCSLLAHALIETQRTEQAQRAFADLIRNEVELIATPALLLEFSSSLLKLRNRGDLPAEQAQRLHRLVLSMHTLVPLPVGVFERAWQVANELGQSDTFDALGYAAAEASEAEFWTSDRRFRNAAASRRLPGVVFVP